ncbi:MAG: inositol-3-phosphate synthase, partial [Candidatus Korarchaeota archaeon]|nr:inositol-3-phosphate synthase [Candidatus Korarchaeota archaeon]
MPKTKVALVGVGNCASAFVQGLHYYKNCTKENGCVGLRNPLLARLNPKDVEIVAAYDVDNRKVGKDLSEAIYAPPNNTPKLAD